MMNQGAQSRFADYFVICGLDVSSGLEPDQLSGESLHCPPLDRPYKSKVLANYPNNVPWNPFDKDAIGLLCLPRGLSFRTQRDCRKPKYHSFIITREDGTRTNGAAFVFYEEMDNKQICAAMQTLQHMYQAELSTASSYTTDPDHHNRTRTVAKPETKIKTFDANRDKLYVTKCIGLVMPLLFVSSARNLLKQLYEAMIRPSLLSLESFVYNILYEVPLPPPGRSMKLYGSQSAIFCQRPGLNELPLFDFNLWELFRILNPEKLMLVFTSVLLEHQILLYSSDYQKLMLCAEAISILVFPFSWQHVYVPILPASLQHFLDAPVPYIMGLHHGSEDRSQLSLPSEANMCFVNIDDSDVEVPEDLPSFPHKHDVLEELQSCIDSYRASKASEIRQQVASPNTPAHTFSNKNNNSQVEDEDKWTNKMEILQQSEAWTKISALAKKAGVHHTVIDDLQDSPTKQRKELDCKDPTSIPEKDLLDLKFNNAVREIFLNCFVHVFHSYETFVIQPSQDMDSWLTNRETMCNFEKAAFLSDQPEAYLPFLSPFTETQMFATLIDNKIISHWEESDPYVRVFDQRIKAMKDQSESRTPVYSKCTTIKDTDTILVKRARFIDHVAPQPHLLEEMNITSLSYNGVFPLLNAEVMNTEPTSIKPKPRESAKWRRKDRLLQHSEHLELQPHQREKYMQEARSKGVRGPKISLMTAAEMLHTNWRFVETLLKEGKLKTKRMLVEKMGQEAVDLGHGEGNLTGVEENTLIASLCDLLERIWSHGLQTKKGKSALWSHLLGYQELQDISENSQPIDPHLLSPGNVAMPTTGCSLRKEEKRGSRLDLNSIVDLYFALCNISMPAITDGEKPGREKTHRRKGSSGRIELPILKPLSRSLVVDMRKVQNMTEIKTDVGFARAWVRLSLEKKILAKHFKELFANSDLLRKLYKRYAFLRCEEEREQFLYHLLSLNAVDYFCFTNSFTNTVMPYKILIFPSLKFGCSTTSANSWISIAGQLGETGTIEIPKGCLECNIEQKNLGVLTTLRIGHDNSGMTPRWLVEYILVRNELSGHTYNFPCGRWLGKNVDDGSTERLLVAELLSQNTVEDIALVSRTPPRCHSPSSPRKNNEQSSKLPEIQEMLGQSVNNLVKYFYKPEKERGNLTFLLCGERGLVQCLELVFQYGFRSARLFRNKFFIWDYLEKVKSHYENLLDSDPNHPISRSIEAKHFCILLHKINNATETIGKDGKFQIFTCIGVRDHCLQKWLPLIANTVITGQMYEENSFLRDPSLLTFLVHILRTLDEFPIVLEASLTQGIEI